MSFSLRLLSPARRSGLWVRLPSKGRGHAQALGLWPSAFHGACTIVWPLSREPQAPRADLFDLQVCNRELRPPSGSVAQQANKAPRKSGLTYGGLLVLERTLPKVGPPGTV